MRTDDANVSVAHAVLTLAKRLAARSGVGIERPAVDLLSERYHTDLETLRRALRKTYAEHRANLQPEALRTLDAVSARREAAPLNEDLGRLSDAICAGQTEYAEAGYLYGLAVGMRLGGGRR
jgi:hypothetical protein